MIYGCEHVTRRYGAHTVLRDLTLSFAPGGCYCLMAPSGAGKTTLFRLLAGLERPDAGQLVGFDRARCAMVFQEDRLCAHLSPVTNAAMVQPGRADRAVLAAALGEILPPACLRQPVRELSGGMKRRVAIARAVLAPSDVLLLDEPFTGLDGDSRARTAEWVSRRRAGRLLIFTTHRADEAALLGAEILPLPAPGVKD